MKEELISIITPMYNSKKYISETIDSVISQTYKNWEWIIIDDASTDGSIEIVKEILIKDKRIKLIEKKINSGQVNSRNIGLKKIKGEIVTFLDSDDVWDKDFLKKQYNFLKKNNAKMVCSNYKRMNEEMTECLAVETVKDMIEYKDLLKRCYFSCLTTLFYKVENIFFDETMEKLEDYLFWLEVLKKYKIAFGNKEVLAMYRIHKNTVSSNKIKNVKWLYIIYKKKLKLNFFVVIYLMLKFIVTNIIKNRKTINYLIKTYFYKIN